MGNDYHPDGKSFAVNPQTVVTSQGVAVQIGADGSFHFDPTTKTVFRTLDDGETSVAIPSCTKLSMRTVDEP